MHDISSSTTPRHLAMVDHVLAEMARQPRTEAQSIAMARGREGRPKPYMPSRAEQAAARAQRAGNGSSTNAPAPELSETQQAEQYATVYGDRSDAGAKITATEQATLRRLFPDSATERKPGPTAKVSDPEDATYRRLFGS